VLFPAEILLFLVCAGVSLVLIVRLWTRHPSDSFFKKMRWSLLLVIPLFGWLFYGALYTPLSENTVRARRTPGAGTWGGN
jgi:hypothetical protein